jgi:tetratricopeptide (TPR) repeat protein
MRVLLRFVLLCSIAMAQSPLRAHADPASDEVKAKANDYVAQGLASQEAGNYDAAIGFYSNAYQLVPHPVLLFNIAQAHRLAGRSDEALALYQKYLNEDPKGAQAKTARELVAELKARKAEEARRAEEARKVEEARNAETARKAEEARVEQAGKAQEMRKTQPTRQADATPAVAAAATSTSQPSPGRNLRIAGLLSGGAAVIAFSVGIGFGLRAQNIEDELSRPMAPYSRDREAEGERANQIAITGYATSGVLLSLGATLYLIGNRRDSAEQAIAIAPVISEQLAGLVISGSFR